MKKVVGVVVLVLVCSAVAWAVALQVTSPDQAAARAVPPPPVPVMAALDQGYLQAPVTLSVTAARERSVQVLRSGGEASVVTAVVTERREKLEAGQVLLRAEGRPVFALEGAFPLYRALGRDDEGDDVLQLQHGLRDAGLSTGRDRAGVFGSGTAAAVERMYREADQDVPRGPSTEAAPEATPAPGTEQEPPTSTPASVPTGPRALMEEIVFVPELPALVESVAAVGSRLEVDTALARLGTRGVVLSASLPATATSALVPGAAGTFTADGDAEGTATIAAVTPDPADAELVQVSLTTSAPVSPGSTYVVAFTNPAAESGEALLAPLAAVVSRGGRSYLYRWDGTSFDEVEVEVVGTNGGVSAVRPVEDPTSLSAGDEVRVGDAGSAGD